MEYNSVCNRTELDDTKSYYQLIKKLQFPRREESSYEKKGKFAIED